MAPSSPTPTSPAQLAAWATELDLPTAVVGSLCEHYGQLARWLAQRQAGHGRPLLVGVNGAQGTGKSTLLALLRRLLQHQAGLQCAGLSLDDLYLTAVQRRALAAEVHPLLATRGVPGTHDLTLAHQVLDALTSGTGTGSDSGDSSYALPQFDKALDDRADAATWPRVQTPADVVVLEGWCVGARGQTRAELAAPHNALEREQDPQAIWRSYVNDQLRGPYAQLFQRMDVLVMLKAPDMAAVRRWRMEQEHALARQLERRGLPNTSMSDAQVEHFVHFFERLTCAMLDEMPGRADLVIGLDAQHRIEQVSYGRQEADR